MKYANFSHNGRTVNSLGDQMQILAVDSIYERMGIDKREIIYINKNEIQEYDGVPVVLPVAFPLFEYCDGGLGNWFPDKIKPVFLGLTMLRDELLPKEVDYYRQHEPIGCRDERMLNTLTKYGVNCYLMGCLTATFPKRKLDRMPSKVFVVDANEDALKHMPEKLRKKVVFCSHFTDEMSDIKRKAKERYELYKSEASLVVTSLLHCSVPCIAAGIPTIITKEKYSYRFAWLERLCRTYLKDEFSDIDWYPQPIEYEEHKELLFKVAVDRINGIDNESDVRKIHEFYMNRKKREYHVDAFDSLESFITKTWTDRNFPYQYAVWGLTQIAEVTVSYIRRNYPNARLVHVYDKHRKLEFEGIVSRSPDDIVNNLDETVFVTVQAAKHEAQSLFNTIGKRQETYAFADVLR